MRLRQIFLAALFVSTSATLVAESSRPSSSSEPPRSASPSDEGDNPRLGLLGLLGLGGLLGLMRRQPGIHIDARRETPPGDH